MHTPVPTGTVLDRILEARRAEVEHRKQVLPETALKYGVAAATPLRDFSAALTRSGLNVLAELKPASPSGGVLRDPFDPVALRLLSNPPEPPRSPYSPKENFFAARSKISATPASPSRFPSCAKISFSIRGRFGRRARTMPTVFCLSSPRLPTRSSPHFWPSAAN